MRFRCSFLAVLAFLNGLVFFQSSLAAECGCLLVSVPEQRIYAFDKDGFKLASYGVSTSKFGLGDDPGSYTTPTGLFQIAEKFGHGVRPGTVFKHCQPTGEILPPNAPGRDAIVTRILTLRGLERQNAGASARGIFIHGTPEERNIGAPASYGCIRMKSGDVIDLFEQVRAGTRIEITEERVGRLFDRFGRLVSPVGKLFPSVGNFAKRAGNTVNRVVDPADRLFPPVGKILDGINKLFVPIDNLVVLAKSKANQRQKTAAEDQARAAIAAMAAKAAPRKRPQ